MKTVLISGGAGFIGKNLIKRFKEENKNVIVVDNFITSNFEDLEEFKGISIIREDITESKIIDIIKEKYHTINEIYHMASLASPVDYKKHQIETLDVGYLGTRNMLELAKYYNCKILFASTSEVYGDARESPQREDYYGNVNSFGERSCYDCSKRVGEALCYSYKCIKDVDIRIARIFNTYGEYMRLDDGRIITEVIKHLMNDTELCIYGDGEQTRSFCYIDDTIDMLIRLMESEYKNPINIGNDNEITINKCVEIIEEIYKKKVKKVYKELTENDPIKRKPDLELNKKILGINKRIEFKIGIKKTIKYFQFKK